MADKKISELSDLSTPTADDLIAVVDSGEVSETKKLTVGNLLSLIYPVGSIYISVSSTSPATLFGGTWSAFGAGKTLVGINALESEFDVVEETGGSKTMAHTHTTADHSHTTTDHSHTFSGTTGNPSVDQYSYSGSDSSSDYFCSRRYHTHGYSGTTSGASTGNTTSGASDGNTTSAASNTNNLQPYIVTYMWKRTA